MLSELISRLQKVMDEHGDLAIASELFFEGSEKYEASETDLWDICVVEHWDSRDDTKLVKVDV